MDYNEIIFNLKKKYLNKVYLKKNRKKIIKIGTLALILVVSLIVLFIGMGGKDEIQISQEEELLSNMEEQLTYDTIIVDVGGEVLDAKVVELPIDSRVEDAIFSAGGLTENADISNINRAAILSDGEKIYIPSKIAGQETTTGGQTPTGAEYSSKVNINIANDTLLQELKGIGPATAEKIIDHREANGNFKKIEDIMDVSGIGEKTFEDIKEDITV